MLGGLAALIAGLVLLFTGSTLFVDINWFLVVPLIILSLALIAFIVWRILKTYKRPTTTGKEELQGSTAVVRKALDPEGLVFTQGEIWTAVSESGRIEAGEEVIIKKINGLTLTVARKV